MAAPLARTLTIADDEETPEVNLSVSPSTVGEGAGSTPVTVTASFSSATTFAEARTVTVTVGGSSAVEATAGVDYTATPASFEITIPSGESSGTGEFTLTPVADGEPEGEERITVRGDWDVGDDGASGRGAADR